MTLRRLTPALLAAWSVGCTAELPSPRTDPPLAQVAAPPPAAGPNPPAAKAALPPADTQDALSHAESAIRGGDVVGGLQKLDEVLRADPDNRRALGLLALNAQELAVKLEGPQRMPVFLSSAAALRRLRARNVELTPPERVLAPQILYNEACALALAGESNRAVASLRDALETGFARLDLIDTDTDLDSLRRLPDFLILQRTAERRSVEARIAATRPFAFDPTLPDLDGKPVALATLRGEVTAVVFWGTWCVPARKQVLNLVELTRRYQGRGLKVVALACEAEAGDAARSAVRTFLEEHEVTLPCLMADEAVRKRLPRFEGYPTTLLLDRDGKVRLQFTGFQPRLTIETAATLLLSEGKPAPAAAAPKPAEKAAKPAAKKDGAAAPR